MYVATTTADMAGAATITIMGEPTVSSRFSRVWLR